MTGGDTRAFLRRCRSAHAEAVYQIARIEKLLAGRLCVKCNRAGLACHCDAAGIAR